MSITIAGQIYYTTHEIAERLDLQSQTIAGWCRKASKNGAGEWRGLVRDDTFRRVNSRWYISGQWLENYLLGHYTDGESS